MIESNVLTVWQTDRKKGMHVKPHTHNFYELVYYLKGDGTTRIGESEFAFTNGDFVVIPPFVQHEENHNEEAIVLCLGFTSGTRLVPYIYNDKDCAVIKILSTMLSESQNQNTLYREMINLKMNELYILFVRNSSEKNQGSREFDFIINYIKENYHEKIQLSDCAKQLNIGYDYFQHKFKAITGMSPQRFLLLTRLAAARKMLLERGENCTEIAYKCGFSSSAQFSMMFKREYGYSPLSYRKNIYNTLMTDAV